MIVVAKYAVIAHYSSENYFSSSFIKLVGVLANSVSEVVVVTTNQSLSSFSTDLTNVSIISRPNIGYDFYSYRVGWTYLYEQEKYGDTIFTNSSYLITNLELFNRAVEVAIHELDSSDLVGITKSSQFSPHIQSYFFGISERSQKSQWWRDWIYEIQPKNSKLDVIFSYELGMTSLFMNQGSAIKTLWRPKWYRKILSYLYYSNRLISTKSFSYWCFNLNQVIKYNPIQIEADAINKAFGFVKNEILGINPLSINSKAIKEIRSFYKYEIEGDANQGAQWGLNGVTSIDKNFPSDTDVIVLAHVHHIEHLSELIFYLDNIPHPFDIWITTSLPSICEEIFNKARFIASGIRISIGPNVGRDVAPFLFQLSSLSDSRYKVGLKLHTKKSVYSESGSSWRKRILDGLLPSANVIEKIMKKISDSDAGIVGGSKEYLTDSQYWGSNFDSYSDLAHKLIRIDASKEGLEFFAGSMFWFKPSAFALSALIPFDGNFLENGSQDGTLAHAFERIFCKIARNSGYRVYGSNNLDTDISKIITQNTVPVITLSVD